MRPPITFFVQGDPKPQPRPRAFVLHGHARVYDAGTAEGWKASIAVAYREACNGVGTAFEGPVSLSTSFHFKRPKSHFRANGQLKPNAPKWVTSRPDLDNLEKAVMDALTQLCAWKDDSYVAQKVSRKSYCVDSENAGCAVIIREVEG